MNISISQSSDFSIHNLPYGIFSTANNTQKRVGVAIGQYILDLAGLAALGLFKHLHIDETVFSQVSLNAFMALGQQKTQAVRQSLQNYLRHPDSMLQQYPQVLVKQIHATMHMPIAIGDYTDFYSSIEHATNVGKMFRDPAKALLPNWRHLPVGYHGRAYSIILGRQAVHRPMGQIMLKGATHPIFAPSERVDFELEMAFVIGKNSALGQRISTAEASNYIFGMLLFNDWSARDIQKWEYVPLGPFLGKSFASSVSAWVVPLTALAPFKVAGPVQEPPVLPHLQYTGFHNYDIALEVGIQAPNSREKIVSVSNFKYMYWNMVQQLAHHTSNGCNVRIGDLMASGTISGKDERSYGSMLELSWNGTKPFAMPDGSTRTFLRDYDTVNMRAYGEKAGIRVGFGELRTQLLPCL